MILLDTDHVSVLQIPDSDRRNTLLARIDEASIDSTIGTTIITIEEQLRGWLASIAKERLVKRHARPYRELRKLFLFFTDWHIADFTDAAVAQFEKLKSAKVRIDTMDLKIASISLANDALLLTANKRDFEQVPGLRFENWLV